MLNLENVKKIYFIGIGGAGMSATAGVAKQMGFEVFGSDSKTLYDPAKSVLEQNSISYVPGYSVSNIEQASADLYIASSGEDLSNPEMQYLSENGINAHSFSELLASLAQDKIRVVIAGTHGKSTTTGMLGKIMQEIDNSSYMTGAVLQVDETNFYVGDGHYFVFEGDEYKSLYDDPTPKFHQYKADILLLTNLEFDHPDIFSNLEEMQNEFRQLISDLPTDGLVVYNADSHALAQIMHESNAGQISFALHNPADFVAINIKSGTKGTSFDVQWTKQGNPQPVIESYEVNLFGEMNVYNTLGNIALLRTLGFAQTQIQAGLEQYHGVKRRFELIGKKNDIIIYDDYAHHPTAIQETLRAARIKYPDARIWAVFEPHTFSRTEATLEDLSKSFDSADIVLLAEIYPAREKPTTQSITSEQVLEAISKHHQNISLVKTKDEALLLLKAQLRPKDVVIVMAVGNFNLLAQDLML